MTNYAVIKIEHRQYIVEPDKTYTIDKFPAEVGTKLDLVPLAVSLSGKFEVGTPELAKRKVAIEIVGQEKGEKVSSFIFKAKARYRKHFGIRKQVTSFKVLGIK